MVRSEALEQALELMSELEFATTGEFLDDIVTSEATTFVNGWPIQLIADRTSSPLAAVC